MSVCDVARSFFAGYGQLWPALNIVSGAALGASFYVLLRTHPYPVSRSYDPKYDGAYLSRFITGVIGGVILATAISSWLGDNGLSKTISPGVLAILGGYSAEAVEQILQRLVDVLLSLVRGDGSAEAQAKAAAENLQRAARLQQIVSEIESAHGANAPQAALDAIRKMRDELRKA